MTVSFLPRLHSEEHVLCGSGPVREAEAVVPWAPQALGALQTGLASPPGPQSTFLLCPFIIILVVQSTDGCILDLFPTQSPGLAGLL